jgi:hypothetical protein
MSKERYKAVIHSPCSGQTEAGAPNHTRNRFLRVDSRTAVVVVVDYCLRRSGSKNTLVAIYTFSKGYQQIKNQRETDLTRPTSRKDVTEEKACDHSRRR